MTAHLLAVGDWEPDPDDEDDVVDRVIKEGAVVLKTVSIEPFFDYRA